MVFSKFNTTERFWLIFMNAFQMIELFILGFTCYFISKNFCMYKGLEAYILLEIKHIMKMFYVVMVK